MLLVCGDQLMLSMQKADAEAVLSAIGAPDKLMVLRGAKSWWHPRALWETFPWTKKHYVCIW
jgi:hypothetical protein